MRVFNEVTGRYIDVPENPRVVSLAPSITDILYRIGAWENVVGVSIYCNIPSKAREKPRVGAYLKVMYRRLEELEPDIVFTTTGAQRQTTFELLEKGYNVYPVKLPVSPGGIIENTFEVAGVLNRVDEAVRASKEMVARLEKVRDRLSGKVYYEIDLGGPVTAGRYSYIHAILEHMGLKNIYGSEASPWIQPSNEYVAQKNPEIILYELKPGEEPDREKVLRMFRERGWSDVEAVKNGRILLMGSDTLAHYGPELFHTLERLVEALEKGLEYLESPHKLT